MFIHKIKPFNPISLILSVSKISLYHSYKIPCLVMRIKQMIIHSNLSKMKNKILPICLQGNWRLRQFRRVRQYIIMIHIIYGNLGLGGLSKHCLKNIQYQDHSLILQQISKWAPKICDCQLGMVHKMVQFDVYHRLSSCQN